MQIKLIKTGFFLTLLVISSNLLADDVGDAIRAAGGTQFSIAAGDAIRVTCRDLGATGQSRTGQQALLFAACGAMSNTVLSVVGSGDTSGDNPLGLTSDEEVYAALRQFSGEETSTQGRYATEGTNNQFSNISARLDAIRSGARSNTFAFNMYGTDLIEAASTEKDTNSFTPYGMTGGSAGSGDGDSGFAWFGTVNYGFGDRDSSDNEDGYDADSYGLTFGVDYVFDSGLVLGGAIGYNDYTVDFDTSSVSAAINNVDGGGMDSDGYTLSGFFDYRWNALYLSGILSFGSMDYDMERILEADTFSGSVDAKTDSDQISGQLQVGYSFGESATTFDVYAALEYTDIEIDSFTETAPSAVSALALTFDKQDIESTQTALGATVRHAISTSHGVMVPYATLEWRHEYDNDVRTVNARYALAPGDVNGDGQSNDFALPTDASDEDYLDLSVGVAGQFGNSLSVFLQYNGVIGLKDTTANQFTLGLRGIF
ncbi:MAG: autotransporter outer membrane beta-barrel domain-containing protein [Pseudomonadales bacterium]|nr:autotransporter outer membrane beta-barrel domain-containing protein [Pseudomonadales bacterium]